MGMEKFWNGQVDIQIYMGEYQGWEETDGHGNLHMVKPDGGIYVGEMEGWERTWSRNIHFSMLDTKYVGEWKNGKQTWSRDMKLGT